MEKRYATHPDHAKTLNTEQLRNQYLVPELFVPGEIKLYYSLEDRVVVGGITPTNDALHLEGHDVIKADYFLQRRELGVINVGGKGTVLVDGEEYSLEKRDTLYIGLGCKELIFKSETAENPAKYYLISTPAHKKYPVQKTAFVDIPGDQMGSQESANKRSIHRIIHENGIQSCQLVMGMTLLEPGSVWNSMPTHTHDRRVEIYMYFDLDENARLFHMMGEPTETRHIVMKNEQAVLSPSWSIHSGVATSNYTFIWAMAGENYTYTDMDHVAMEDLR